MTAADGAAPTPDDGLRRPVIGLVSAAPGFDHLARLTDDTGLFEHARHAIVRRQHGYCTDDVARGLVVTCREPDPSETVLRLSESYLTFLTHAQDGGAFHNRLGYDRRWTDQAGVGDWWGRALWGLGTAAARSPASWIRDEAFLAFAAGARRRSSAPHAMAFAGLGAAEVLQARPGDTAAAALLSDAADTIVAGFHPQTPLIMDESLAGALPPADSSMINGVSRAGGRAVDDPEWSWPVPSLSYASAALAEVVVAAGHAKGDDDLLATGLRMLRWLHQIQFTGSRLAVVPVGGWRRGAPRSRYDQQPIEVAALADACGTASLVTGDNTWDTGVRHAAAWFLGANDAGTVMWDPDTGGGYDGLTPEGPNLNQGAESTLALLSTLRHARRWS